MTIFILVLIVASFLAGLFIGKVAARKEEKSNRLRRLAGREIFELVTCRLALQFIREQKMLEAIEFLETSLDDHISSLWIIFRNRVESSERKNIDVALNRAKAYRQKWPREIGPSFSSELSSSQKIEIADQARDSLAKVPPIPLPDIEIDSILAYKPGGKLAP